MGHFFAKLPVCELPFWQSYSAAVDGWVPTEGTPLSRHNASTLEPRRRQSAVGTGRAAQKKRGLLRRTGIVLPAAAIAAVVVAAVTIAAYEFSPNGSGADNLSQAINALPKSHSIALLEQEREKIIVMNEAASTMNTAAKPTVVSPAMISDASGLGSSGSGSGSSGNSATSQDTTPVAAPDPGTAQHIAYEMMSSFGFSPSTQWECLDEVWQKESSWQYDAENASGAYGIPQSLPASKMASAGSDYLTNPATQIKWGLGYISSTYGTPCNAWAHEESDGWY
jgi:transglycosylase-like protein with SLT domain